MVSTENKMRIHYYGDIIFSLRSTYEQLHPLSRVLF